MVKIDKSDHLINLSEDKKNMIVLLNSANAFRWQCYVVKLTDDKSLSLSQLSGVLIEMCQNYSSGKEFLSFKYSVHCLHL